jgi:hypothetical protein
MLPAEVLQACNEIGVLAALDAWLVCGNSKACTTNA